MPGLLLKSGLDSVARKKESTHKDEDVDAIKPRLGLSMDRVKRPDLLRFSNTPLSSSLPSRHFSKRVEYENS
jgi:hypothetical protein